MNAEQIKSARELAGMTQYSLSRATGIERARISGLENGHIEVKPEEIAAIRKCLEDTSTNLEVEVQNRKEQITRFLHTVAVA